MTRRYRVALISAFPPGARSLNEYGLHLAKGLAARDDVEKVIVLADKLDSPQPEIALPDKVRMRRCWRFNKVTNMLSLVRTLRDERPDGVIYNLQMATFGDRELPVALGLMTPFVSKKLGFASGVIAHNLVSGVDLESTVLKGQWFRQKIVKLASSIVTRAMTSASYLTVTVRSYEEHLRQNFPRAKVHLVPHGTFDTQERPWLPMEGRPERIVTMGKFGTYKKLETLLDAFDRLRSDPAFARYELHIGGSDHPNTPGYLAELAEGRKEDRGVTFKGYVAEDAIPDFFENARLSVFDYETTTGSSGVLHQTASYGAVPVFPRIGDFVDLCEDEGLQGLHYSPGDVESMAAAIRRALSYPEESQKIALENRNVSQGIPFSEVIDFHMIRISALIAEKQDEKGQKDAAVYTKSTPI